MAEIEPENPEHKAVAFVGLRRKQGQFTPNLAKLAILQRGHPVLAIKHGLAHFPRLNLR